MIVNKEIVYVAPPFEEVQHEVTKFSKDNKPLEASLHTDISLLQRIDRLSFSAKQIETLKSQLQPLIDKSSFSSQFEEAFGKLTDEELISSCPSRYINTASEQMDYLKSLAKQHSEEVQKSVAKAKEAKAKKELEDEENEFQSKLMKLWS